MPRFTFENKFTFGNIIQIGLLLLAAIGVYYGLIGRVDATALVVSDLKPSVIELQTSAASFNTRLTVVESRAETQAVRMQEMAQAIEQLSTAVQGLTVTAATTKTDVGYIRDFIEEQKREARQ